MLSRKHCLDGLFAIGQNGSKCAAVNVSQGWFLFIWNYTFCYKSFFWKERNIKQTCPTQQNSTLSTS